MIRVTNIKEIPTLTNKTKSYRIMCKTLQCIQFCIGFNFGYLKFKSRTRMNIITTVQCVVLCTYYLSNLTLIYDRYVAISTVISSFRYVIVVAILLLKNEASFADFNSDIRKIDQDLKTDTSGLNFDRNFLIILVGIIVFRAATSIVYFYDSGSYCWHVLPILIIPLIFNCLDILLLTWAFVFYAINHRMKILLSTVENAGKDFKKLHCIYKSIADLIDKYKAVYDLLLICSLLFIVPEVMGAIFSTTVYIRRNINGLPVGLSMAYFVVTEQLILLFLPAANAGLLAVKANQIKIAVREKLMTLRDNVVCSEVIEFADYISARPLALTTWQLIPLNAHLITEVLGFCVTYLIVIIQFTNDK